MREERKRREGGRGKRENSRGVGVGREGDGIWRGGKGAKVNLHPVWPGPPLR